MRASFIHVQLSRCQEFCQASHCSVSAVPVKHSVSISLVKHYCQATAERGREGGREGGRGREERGREGWDREDVVPFILSSFNKHGPLIKRVHEEISAGETKGTRERERREGED